MADEVKNENLETNAETEKTETVETFTAEQVAEKEASAKDSVFSDLGIDSKNPSMIEAVKQFISKFGKEEENETEKADENKTDEQLAEAERKRFNAEAKVEAMVSGAKSQFVEDVVTLALAKADGTTKTDIKTAIAEVKAKFPDMFVSSESDKEKEHKKEGQKGTGSTVNNKKDSNNDNKNNGIGKRLGVNRRSANKKVTYWN